MPAVDQAPLHGAIVDPSELAAVPGSMLDAAKAYAADVLSLPAEPPRTLPVTPAERHLATMLRAWLAWNAPGGGPDHHDDTMRTLFDLGDVLIKRGLARFDDGALTPAGTTLLARVEAAERTPETLARDLVMALQTSGAPGALVSEAQSVLVNVRACDRRLAGTTPIDAPPAKEPAR